MGKITLRAARVNAGFTQAQAAKLIGISKYTLLKYERGTTLPNVKTLKRIEELYKIPFEDLTFNL